MNMIRTGLLAAAYLALGGAAFAQASGGPDAKGRRVHQGEPHGQPRSAQRLCELVQPEPGASTHPALGLYGRVGLDRGR